MNLLKTIIERLNQRVEVANIFDKQFNLCELNANGNDKAWVHYIGNGQAEVVTNFDAKNGTLFWAKRGKVTVAKTDAYKMSGCKQLYVTSFPLTAYAIVRKSHLPCDAEDAQDWLASRVYKLTSGTDPLFKQNIGVINYEVVPSGYANEIKTLTANYEWACVSVDMDVQVITTSEDGCYDTCATGDIPLPDLPACVPCLTEVAVDGVTIIGNGTAANPLVAVGGEGGAIAVEEEGVEVTPIATTLNFVGEGVTASLTSPGVVEVNVPGGSGVISVTATAPLASSEGNTPDISITQADGSTDGYLSSADWNTFDGKFDVPTGAGTDYLDGTGAPIPFPTFVTSVDLSMPAAFSVSGNPVTTSGTLAVTANGVATQYIRGDGQLATLPSNASGGSAVSYYLNGGTAASVATYFQMSQTAVIGTGVDFSLAGNGLISQWLTDANDPNRLEIPAGNWNFEIYLSASSAGGTPAFYVELLKYDGSFTTIANSSAAPENITGGTSIDLYLTSLAIPQTTLLVTDRLALRVYIVNSVGGRTINMHTQDSHLCQVVTNFAGGISALNGLTANTQYLAVGTSGTDFGISSASATHTFNLPTASASNRGALSAADFTTFAAKQDAITLTTTGTSGAATFASNVLNIPIYGAPLIYKSTTDTASFSNTTNTVVYTQLITANTFAVGDIIRLNFRTRKTGTLGLQTLRMYVNTTADLSGTPLLVSAWSQASAASLLNQMLRHWVIKNATTNTETLFSAFTGFSTDYGTTSGMVANAINWTANRYIVFALQNTNAADVNFGSIFFIEKI